MLYLTATVKNTTAVTQNIEIELPSLTGVVQLVGCHPAKRKVTGSIPGQSICLGRGCGPRSGTYKRQPISVSLPLFLPPFPLSKNK